MHLRLFIIVVGVVIAMVAGIAALTHNGADAAHIATPADTVRSLEVAFPALSATQAADPAIKLPGTKLVAAGSVAAGGGRSVAIAATEAGELCVAYDGTTVCTPGASAAQSGAFLAAVDCSAQTTSLVGVVPEGVTSATALGSAKTLSVSSAGGLIATIPGTGPTGVVLNDGNTARFDLSPALCG